MHDIARRYLPLFCPSPCLFFYSVTKLENFNILSLKSITSYLKVRIELQLFVHTFYYFFGKKLQSQCSFLSCLQLVMLQQSAKLFKWVSSLVRCKKVKGKPLKSVRDLNYVLRDRRGKTAENEKRERGRVRERTL